ncbi:MAG: DsbA family oxidoreductase [Gammaproteobacteria bacterium]|jgi:predicted DsbA family dithiol-disulfide isomerase|uniref:DsbA family oxidoreductase n=1 Tax=Nevskia sp. TaxID=1929292 RepID=UPI004036BFCB|nr:DsbA family oxidoreductase [Gammaproteobacteria bacterium]
MLPRLKIDYVSDLACPWCAIGLAGLVEAASRLQGELEVELHFQPFELNRNMPPEGVNLGEHLVAITGGSAAQVEDERRNLTAIAAEAGLAFKLDRETRIWNSFDGHRLVYWAEQAGDPLLLKTALFKANFCEGRQISNHEVLADIAAECGLDGARAREILSSETYLDEVDERMKLWLSRGIRGVPAIIFNERHIVEGGQSASTFVNVMRQIAGLDPAPTPAPA